MSELSRRAERLGRAASRLLPAGATALVGAALVWGVSALPERRPGLLGPASLRLQETGVENPVTAVLLAFRAYDTLLEVAVLLLAAIAVSGLRLGAARPGEPPDRHVLQPLSARLLPVMILVGAYLLWRGADAPGGAFQAGAIWGAIGVLWSLARREAFRISAVWVRAALVLGPAVFLGAAAVTAAAGALLAYPPGWSKPFIMTIETAVALSIGATLTVLYAGRVPSSS